MGFNSGLQNVNGLLIGTYTINVVTLSLSPSIGRCSGADSKLILFFFFDNTAMESQSVTKCHVLRINILFK